MGLSHAKGTYALIVLLQRCTSLLCIKEIGLRKKTEGIILEAKGRALFWGAVNSSVLLKRADPIGNERRRKKKQHSDTVPNSILLTLSPQGEALTSPRVAKCSGQY